MKKSKASEILKALNITKKDVRAAKEAIIDSGSWWLIDWRISTWLGAKVTREFWNDKKTGKLMEELVIEKDSEMRRFGPYESHYLEEK